MFIPSTFKRPVSSWKALNLRKTLLMASSVRLKPLNCSRLPCVYAQETLTRSEERRVGKECRCRWWPYDKKKKAKKDRSDIRKGSQLIVRNVRRQWRVRA